MDHLFQDLRYALRGLRRSPGFTAVAVVTLALGIGVNSSIFSLVNAVLLKPLPVDRPEELVDIYSQTVTSLDHGTSSYPNLLDYQAQTETLSGIAGYSNFFANLSVGQTSGLAVGELVTEDFFSVLGVEPVLGRSFVPEEYSAPGAFPVAVLSHSYWQTRFAGDPDILGQTFRMNGVVYTVVGVAPRDFGGMFPPLTAQMWIPSAMVEEVEPMGNQRGSGQAGVTRLEQRDRHWLWLRGRLNPGVSIEQARAELTGISARLASQYPETNELERLAVLRSNDVAINPDFDRTLAPAGMVLMGAVALVLLVMCANLANMMLARAATRRRELSLRLAIGANRGRVVRQMVTESLVLSLAGGAVALALAYWLTALIGRLQPPLPIDIGLQIDPDWRVMGFTFLAAIATGILLGLLPALKASRPDLVTSLKEGGDQDGPPGRRFQLRDALVVAQVAVSLVLLVSGALMVRSLSAANKVELGYDADHIAYLSLAMEMNGYDQEQARAFYDAARIRLEALPQVSVTGSASRLPLSLNNNGFSVVIDGHQSSDTDEPYFMDGASISPGYFDALGVRMIAGRGIDAADREETRRVAVVTQAMAQRFWPGEDPIGQEFRTSWGARPHQIIGVVEDYKVDTPGEAPKPYIHLPLHPNSTGDIMVRTTTPASEMVAVLERELRALDPELVFLDTGTIREFADVRLFPIRAGAWLIGAFGLLALVLAAVGLYGVIGYAVSRRTREMGVRKALGAEASRVVGLVLGKGMTLVLVGGLIGAGLAAVGAQFLSNVLYVGSFDPISFAAAFGVLLVVAALANWIPARRAAMVDPMVALRGD
ncbi:MAG: ABC transporter permease [Longimicrobiales bacterium]